VAEIRVAPKRNNRTIVLVVLVLLIVAVLAWYFLAGPGVSA
jgi:hypothetical protein